MKLDRSSWGLRLFAVAFSILLWAMAPRPQGGDGDLIGWVERPVLAPVDIRGVAENLEVVESPEWVTVHLRGTRLLPIDTERIQVYVDLSNRFEGVHNVPVTVIPPVGVQVSEVNPANVDVRIEAVLDEEFPVNVAALGLPSEASVEVLRPNPEVVKIIGRSGHLQRVADVIAPIRLQTGAGTQSGEVAVQAVDADGLVVSDVRIVPERVFVRIVVRADDGESAEKDEAQ